jgi:hypothetical protein
MAGIGIKSSGRPRELRRRVLLPARMRNGGQWADACILNISSRGLMIQSARAGPEGSVIELRRGEHVIVARVVWRDGARAGLQSEQRVPVEEIMSLSGSQALQLVANEGALIDRRSRPRPLASASHSRLQGRAMEFAAVLAIGAALAIGAWSTAQQAFAKPLERASAALGG